MDNSKHTAHHTQIDDASDASRRAFAVGHIFIIPAIIGLTIVLPLITIS